MAVKYRCFYLSFVLAFFFATAAKGDESVSDTQAVLQEALDAWDKYGDFISHCEGVVYSHTKWYDEKGAVDEEEETVSNLICDYPLVVFAFRLNQNKTNITGINRDYSFKITEEGDDVYSVVEIHEAENLPGQFSWVYRDWDQGGNQRNDTMDSFISNTFADSLLAPSIPLPVLFKRPDCNVTQVERFAESGINRVRISFVFSPEFYSPIMAVRSGNIVLLSDSCWLPERMELNITDEEHDKSGTAPFCRVHEFEYQNDFAMPLLREYRCETSVTGHTTWNFVRDYDLKYVKHGTYPKKRFTLSYYGLPEPDFVEKKFTPFRIFMFVIGLGFILLSAYQLRRNWGRYQGKSE